MGSADRTERPLTLDLAVRTELARLCAAEMFIEHPVRSAKLSKAPLKISLETLGNVEKTLRTKLSDDTLALLCCRSGLLENRYKIALENVGQHTERAHKRLVPNNLVALGKYGKTWFCVDPEENHNKPTLLCFQETDGSISKKLINEWLVDRFDEIVDETMMSEEVYQDIYSDENVEALSFILVIPPPETPVPQSSLTRVSHTKFGTGTVLGTTGSGTNLKYEINFDEIGKKVILARFVEPL